MLTLGVAWAPHLTALRGPGADPLPLGQALETRDPDVGELPAAVLLAMPIHPGAKGETPVAGVASWDLSVPMLLREEPELLVPEIPSR